MIVSNLIVLMISFTPVLIRKPWITYLGFLLSETTHLSVYLGNYLLRYLQNRIGKDGNAEGWYCKHMSTVNVYCQLNTILASWVECVGSSKTSVDVPGERPHPPQPVRPSPLVVVYYESLSFFYPTCAQLASRCRGLNLLAFFKWLLQPFVPVCRKGCKERSIGLSSVSAYYVILQRD